MLSGSSAALCFRKAVSGGFIAPMDEEMRPRRARFVSFRPSYALCEFVLWSLQTLSRFSLQNAQLAGARTSESSGTLLEFQPGQ